MLVLAAEEEYGAGVFNRARVGSGRNHRLAARLLWLYNPLNTMIPAAILIASAIAVAWHEWDQWRGALA